MNILWTWVSGSFSNMLEYLGLLKKPGKLLVIGLDNAGKTTLLKRLKDGTMGTHLPTWYPTKQDLSIGKTRFVAFDIGGHVQARKIWKKYCIAVDAIVFVVDASDRQRIPEARYELDSLIYDFLSEAEMPTNAPVLVLGNKIDRFGAASEEEMRHHLGLVGRTTGKPLAESAGKARDIQRPMELFMCSMLKEYGYGEALSWLMSHL